MTTPRRGKPCEVCGDPCTRNRNRFCSLRCRDAWTRAQPKPSCEVADCDAVQRCKGLCRVHYARLLKHGDPLTVRQRAAQLGVEVRPLADRLWEKVDQTPTCWVWTGARAAGYGRISVLTEQGKRIDGAHRVAYELLVGPIPDGLVIDHLCENRACVNPAHLEPVTPAENTRRAYKPRQWRADA